MEGMKKDAAYGTEINLNFYRKYDINRLKPLIIENKIFSG